MRSNIFLLSRSVLVVAILMLAFMSLELVLDLASARIGLGQLALFDVTEARHFNNLLNRSLNQLTGVAFTTVALAVPLTANMYSVKFLDIFIKDPINATVLPFVLFANLNNIWWGSALKDDYIPYFEMYVSLALTVVCFSLMFPYLYYIFRFLHPNTLLVRLEREFLDAVRRAQRQPRRAAGLRLTTAEAIEHIANIAIRSVDRGDRNTAIESVFTLDQMMRAYWARKAGLAPAWFEADPFSFLGFSSSAVDELTASRTWVEMKVFSELRQVMAAGVPRMSELVSTVAKTLRKLGVSEVARSDQAVRELVVEHFNTFIRQALSRKDPRSVFIIFDQYRALAEALNADFPDLVLEIAYYFEYYGQVARDQGLPFVVEAVAHDLGGLVQFAWQTEAANRQQLLEGFLRYDGSAPRPLPGVKKAQALLASYFLLAGRAEAAGLIRSHLIGLDPALLRTLQSDLLHVTREKYWEVNERRMNIDYVPEPQREKLREFFTDLQAAAS